MSASQVEEKWGIKQRGIRVLCTEGRIKGAYNAGTYQRLHGMSESEKMKRSAEYRINFLTKEWE